MNSVNLIGRLTADPNMRYFESGKVIAKFHLAINRTKDETDFFEIEAWEKTAEVIGQYCRKGHRLGSVVLCCKSAGWTGTQAAIAQK